MIDTSLDSSNFYFLFAVLQGLVLTGLIIFQKKFRLPHLYLGLLIFLLSISLLHLILEESIHIFNARFPIPMDFGLAFGPLAYLHVLSIKNPRRKFHLRDLYHFLPSFLIDGVLYTALFIYLGSHMEWAYAHVETIQSTALIAALVGLVQLGVYSLLIYKEARVVKSSLKEFTNIKKWVQTLSVSWTGLIIFLILAVPFALLNIDLLDENSSLLYRPISILIGLYIYGLGYLYLLKYMKPIGAYIDRMMKFSFSESEMEEKKVLLLEHLKTSQQYHDPKISLAQLAQQLKWPINDLSFLINEGLRSNFNDFINQLRVQSFQELVLDPENKKYSIVGLSEQVGFSSKASFYRAFKKETGTTPTAYLKENSLK